MNAELARAGLAEEGLETRLACSTDCVGFLVGRIGKEIETQKKIRMGRAVVDMTDGSHYLRKGDLVRLPFDVHSRGRRMFEDFKMQVYEQHTSNHVPSQVAELHDMT